MSADRPFPVLQSVPSTLSPPDVVKLGQDGWSENQLVGEVSYLSFSTMWKHWPSVLATYQGDEFRPEAVAATEECAVILAAFPSQEHILALFKVCPAASAVVFHMRTGTSLFYLTEHVPELITEFLRQWATLSPSDYHNLSDRAKSQAIRFQFGLIAKMWLCYDQIAIRSADQTACRSMIAEWGEKTRRLLGGQDVLELSQEL